MLNHELKSIIKKFYELQEERVYTYRLLAEGHKVYLSTTPDYDFVTYRQLVHEVTQEFKRISDAVINIEEQLKYDLPDAANYLTQVQEAEELKLKLTAKLQIAKQSLQDHKEHTNKTEMFQVKNDLCQVVEKINECIENLKYETEGL